MASDELIPDALWAGHLDAHSHSLLQSKIGETICPVSFEAPIIAFGPTRTNFGAEYVTAAFEMHADQSVTTNAQHDVIFDGYENPTTLTRTYTRTNSSASPIVFSSLPIFFDSASAWWLRKGQWDLAMACRIEAGCKNTQGGADPDDQTLFTFGLTCSPRHTFSTGVDQYSRASRQLFNSGTFSSATDQSWTDTVRLIHACWWDIRFNIGVSSNSSNFADNDLMATASIEFTRRA